MGKLTVSKVKGVKEPGLYGDGGTLFLHVAPGGTKSWVQRLVVEGKRKSLGLGSIQLVTLAEARHKAYMNRKIARDGGDPCPRKNPKREVPTFREAFEKTYESLSPTWRNKKTGLNFRQRAENYVFPVIGDIRVNAIVREDVLLIVKPIWRSKHETARQVRRVIRTVLDWAMAHGYLEINVTQLIDGALHRDDKTTNHLRALPHHEVASALETIEDSMASMSAKLCLRFLVLTAVRSGEARGAEWSEVDLDSRSWVIPAQRMKASPDGHRVPLSDAAIEVLERSRELNDGSALVFPSPLRPGKPLSDMTLTKVLRDRGLADRATVHGFRSSFRDWCAETGKPREIAEAALAHTVGGVEGAYFRSDLFEKRRQLMDAWAHYLSGLSAKVVRLHG